MAEPFYYLIPINGLFLLSNDQWEKMQLQNQQFQRLIFYDWAAYCFKNLLHYETDLIY